MTVSHIDGLTERELDALTWREFFKRSGEREMDAEGFWSTRMGVRFVYPRYADDASAVSRIEVEINKRGLHAEYVHTLITLLGLKPGDTDVAASQPTPDATPGQRRKAALEVALLHKR